MARVTLNRVADPKYPKSICEVVYQKNQFSWTHKKHKIVDKTAWKEAVAVAKLTEGNPHIMNTFKATHYHNTKVHPSWNLSKVGRIQHHIFYM